MALEHYKEVFRVLAAPKIFGAPKLIIIDDLATQWLLHGQYLQRGTSYRQSGNGVGNHKGSPTSSQNFTNFGPLTAQSRTVVLTLRNHLLGGGGHHVGLLLGVSHF